MSIIREYFAKENVLEIETPILSSAGNTDVNIESFTSQGFNNSPISYLRTSPEFPLKRLLSQGIGDVFEIAKVFRQGEISTTHNVEFTLMEWYRIGYDYNQLIHDVTELFYSIFAAFKQSVSAVKILTFEQCFTQFLSIDLKTISAKQLHNKCCSFDYSGSLLTRDEALDYLFATQIQNKLKKNELTFVTLYPSSQAALAQINPNDSTTSLRFEVFYQGHELGNGYQELTDSDELLQRFEQDNIVRKTNNLKPITIDHRLINDMKNMPECSGIAVGIDRLLMVLLGVENIKQVIAFPANTA